MMNLSVVTVVFDDEAALRRTWESIREQRVGDSPTWEWLIIDGASPGEGMQQLLVELEACGARVLSERDSGIYDAMNKGLRLARGQYVLFLNAGDTLNAPEALNVVLSRLSSPEQADLYLFAAKLDFPGLEFLRKPRPLSSAIWHGLPAVHQATIYKTEKFKSIGYDTGYVVCGDYSSVAMLYEAGATAVLDERVIVRFELGGTSTRKIVQLMLEPIRVQRNVLRSPWASIVLSTLRRFLTVTAMLVLYHGSRLFASSFGRRKLLGSAFDS